MHLPKSKKIAKWICFILMWKKVFYYAKSRMSNEQSRQVVPGRKKSKWIAAEMSQLLHWWRLSLIHFDFLQTKISWWATGRIMLPRSNRCELWVRVKVYFGSKPTCGSNIRSLCVQTKLLLFNKTKLVFLCTKSFPCHYSCEGAYAVCVVSNQS